MNVGEIIVADCANGTGIRVSVFVSGCTNRCPGCFQPEVTSGVLSGECAALLTDFFRALRKSRAEAKKGIIDAL